MYTIWTRTHPYSEDLRERWSPDGDKQVPDDLGLTPLRAELRYLYDGYLDVGRHGRPRIEIETRNEEKHAEFPVGLFENVGISPLYRRHELRFTCDETEELAEWMGDQPPGFEYNWALDSRERYRELREQAHEGHATQTPEARLTCGSGSPSANSSADPTSRAAIVTVTARSSSASLNCRPSR